MAKTRSAEKAAQADAEDRIDGLEIISIGSLYKGAWDKKYWTTSRGKDRYPYPVGYQAVRAYNGATYKMEICEGVNGPRFLISSDDGSSSSGKTPDQAWEEFQKKGCPRIKIWHGKRLSSKMDGLELFGFKNQFIQRLLREIVTNINGIAERSLVSPNICDGITRTDHDDCCPNVGAYPGLLLCLRKPHVTGKRSRCELKNKKYNVRARPQSPEFTCSRPSNVKNEKSLGQGSSTTHYGSEVHEVHNQLHRSHDVELKLSNLLVTSEDKKLMQSCSKESVGCIDIDIYAPDTLDFVQENTPDSAPSELGKSAYNETICEITSGDLLNAEHEEVLKSNSNPSSEKSDFGSAGQDVANSMMSFLLPQAVPLLRNVSTDKEFTISPSNMLPSQVNSKDEQNKIGYSLDLLSSGVSNALSGVRTKSCQLESTETLAEKTQDEVVDKTGNAETLIMSSMLPKLVYTRRKLRNAIPFQEKCSVMECTEYDKFELVTPEMYTAKDTLPPSETILINNSNDKPCEPVDTAGLCVETPQTHSDVLGGHSDLVEPDPTSSQNPALFADENKCFGTMEAQLTSEPMPLQNQELKNNLGSSVKFVGRYLHPMPVSSLFLSAREDEIHVCVLCGHLMDQYRTLFIYKVAITEPTLGCPSVMAHSSILLPDPKHNFIKEIMVERSGVQLSPGGQYIILIGSIKTPNCREEKIDCYCSTCTSVCSEKNALKIVQVEHGYVSVVTTLETVDNVHCILVCEPNRLVSVGESGRLQVWVMNSTWSEKIEYFIIPADGSVSPGIVELKRVPKCTHLVVGHNSCGEFSLWDIAKCNCVTSFSALKSPINGFFPISLFQWQTKGSGFSYASTEEQADKLLEATNLWYSEQRETCWFSPSKEDVAMWLFVLTTTDLDCCHNHVSTSSSYDTHTAGSWRLALLKKNSIVFGSPLDLRTSGIGVSCGYGIIGTSDGVVHMWELSKGSKLGTLHHFQDGNVTCVATDDSRGALGVAGGGGQLLLYLHLPELDSN